MPERLIREGILDSDDVNAVSPEAELFYRRLMSIVDDYGRYEWDLKKVRLRAFGYRFDWATEDRLKKWMADCEKNNLIIIYKVKGRSYFQIEKFRQRFRSKHSKFPGPEDSEHYKENYGHVTGTRHADDGQMPGTCARRRDGDETETNAETNAALSDVREEEPDPEPTPPPPPRGKPEITTRREGGRIVGLSRPGPLKFPDKGQSRASPLTEPERAFAQDVHQAFDGRLRDPSADPDLVRRLKRAADAMGAERYRESMKKIIRQRKHQQAEGWGLIVTILEAEAKPGGYG